MLNDVEEKEITDTIVKEWLDELKDSLYHAEDLLDEITTEALRCQVEADFVTSTSKYVTSSLLHLISLGENYNQRY